MKKHTHYDSTEMRALKNSAIPAAIMASPGTRFDSAEDASMFFARELDHVKAQSYDVQYPEFTALNLFPISSEADPGAETHHLLHLRQERPCQDHRQLQHRPAPRRCEGQALYCAGEVHR